MISYPNAKINLGLSIIEKRPDGYHNIESVFYPIPLKDRLEIKKSKAFSFSTDGLKIDGSSKDNLVVKAYNTLKINYNIPAVSIHLNKVIPFGGGLGGGSSDAAFCLKMLNDLFKLEIKAPQLKDFAKQLGADCPFFIDNKPAYIEGIGDIINPIKVDLKNYFLILITPPIGVPTPLAYSKVKPQVSKIKVKETIINSPRDWGENLKNDFEDSVFEQFPNIEAIKLKLYNAGALYASMSGSGSTVFGLFESVVNLQNEFTDCFYYSCYL